MSDLYERIALLCRQKGVTGSKMCLDLGMSKSTMSELKHGRTKGLNAITAQKISSYLGVTVEELLGEESQKPEVSEEDIKVALFGGDQEVTDEDWAQVKNFVDFIKSTKKK